MSMLQAGLGIFQNIGSFIYQKRKAENDRLWQDYNNRMVRIQDGMNQNAITTNENMRQERLAIQKFSIQKQEMSTLASAEVAAAATGTVGRSVNMVMHDISRNAAGMRGRLERDDEYALEQARNQREQSAMGAQLQLDLRDIPDPNPASMLMGIAGNIGKLWKN
jgi:hypothetical protein